MQASCPARDNSGTSLGDAYTGRHRVRSYHPVPSCIPLDGAAIVERLGCYPGDSGKAGVFRGSRYDRDTL